MAAVQMEYLDVTDVLCFLVGCMVKLHQQEQAVFHNVMCRRTRRILIQPERLNLPEIVFITEKNPSMWTGLFL